MKIAKVLKTTLHSPLSSSGTSVVLKKFVDLDGTELAMSDFGDFGVIVIKQGDTVEMIKFSALSQSSTDATCTLTVATNGRSIAGTSPYAGASTGEDFQSGAEVIVSNDPLTLSRFANLDVAGTFTAIMTFSALPQITAGNPVAANDIARKAYVDSVVAGIATTINVIVAGTAGETLVAGNLIYFDDTDNEWKKCDADTAATVENAMLGIAQGAGVDGGAISGGVLVRGLDANQSGLAAGAIYYASNTAGGLSSSAGTKEVTIGFAYSATQIYFNPRFNQQLTENQQDLIEAIEGGTDFYAASAVGTDAYAITIAPAITAYVTGMKFRFKADVANTGAATLAVSGLSALAIKKLNDQDLITGDIEIGQIVEVVYDGTDWQMQSQVAQLAGDGSALTSLPEKKQNMQVFTASGTWTKPTGVTNVIVKVVGGGGAGGGVSNGAGELAGGGGGAGGYAEAEVVVSGNVTVTVGAAGSAASGVAGGAGGNSSFAGAVTVTANGGSGGALGESDEAETAGGAGGATTNGDLAVTGKDGESAHVIGVSGYIKSGAGGSNPLGFGGNARVDGAAAGVAGVGYGAGGSGARNATDTTARAGGAGTGGVVIVYWNE